MDGTSSCSATEPSTSLTGSSLSSIDLQTRERTSLASGVVDIRFRDGALYYLTERSGFLLDLHVMEGEAAPATLVAEGLPDLAVADAECVYYIGQDGDVVAAEHL